MPDTDIVDILVVDDHPENLIALEALLSTPGQRVVAVSSGAEALRRVLRQEYAVILLDVVMPGMDGFETAHLIRQREASRHIPIIFLTAHGADVGLLYRGYAVGAVDYLVKPLETEIVKAKVATFVDLHRKERQSRKQQERLREAERRRSLEALRVSEAQYEATFREAPVGIGILELDGRFLRANARAGETLGFPDGELLGRRLQDFLAEDDLPRSLQAFKDMLSGQRDADRGERRFLDRAGSTLWLNLSLSVLRDDSGAPRQFVAVLEDITARKYDELGRAFLAEASDILLSSLDYRATLPQVLRRAIDAVADWALVEVVAADGGREVIVAHRALALEPRLRALWEAGTPAADADRRAVIVESSGDLFAGEQADALLDKAGFVSGLRVPLVVRGALLGRLVLVAAPGSRRFGPADLAVAEELARRIGFAIENARLFVAAQEAVRAREEFLSIASHELRTPLTALVLEVQRLVRRDAKLTPALPERILSAHRRIERHVQRFGALIDNLMDVARMQAGKLELNLEPVELTALVADVSARFRDDLARAGCELVVDAGLPVPGHWDRFRLEQVLTNLISNAIKYGQGKPIRISALALPEGARVSIHDQGIGIPPEQLPRIFERFERAVPSRHFQGLGLGLFIVRQIVEAHGGEIRVDSRLGEGSVFVVELPRVAAIAAPGELEGAARDRAPAMEARQS